MSVNVKDIDPNDVGLVFSLLSEKDFNDIIKLNNLKEVTNPTYMANGYPTSDGLLSYEIFGSNVSDRKIKMAYIDLKGHYMQPIAALKLKTFDRRLYDILYGFAKYRLEGTELIEDDENGRTGPEYLYEIWDKVPKKEKSSILTKEIQDAFDSPKEDLFMSKFLVIPAAYRDIHTGSSTIGMNSINDTYAQIIAYTKNIELYSSEFDTSVQTISKARVQALLVDIWSEFMIKKVKGVPSKNGKWKKEYRSKNIDYTSRAVIAARDLNQETPDDIQVKYGQIGLPLAQICSNLYPFMLFELKRYLDNEFLRGGKYPYKDSKSGDVKYCTIMRSYDEEEISKMIDNYINTPGVRFNKVPIPENDSGKDLVMYLRGRLDKENTTLIRPATFTDILYIVAVKVCSGKYDLSTRYPLTSMNGQFTGEIIPLSTKKTEEITIGSIVYKYFPTAEGDPESAFMDVQVFSNTILKIIGGDHDGDQLSNKVPYSSEANMEAKEHTESIAHLVNSDGNFMRSLSKEFIVTSYMLTRCSTPEVLKTRHNKPPTYEIK